MYVSSDRRGDPVKKRTNPKKYTFIAAAAVAVGSVFFCFAADSADRKLPSAPAASVYSDTVYDDTAYEEAFEIVSPDREREKARSERLIDLNTAGLEELTEISGIGESTARLIIEKREALGGFSSVDQLLEINGIGESKLEEIKKQAYVPSESTASENFSDTAEVTEVPETSVSSAILSETEISAETAVTSAAETTVSETEITSETTVVTSEKPSVSYPLDINTATAEELKTISGVGDVIAERIIEYRTKNGGFNSVDRLIDVKGIGEKKLAAIRPYVFVYGEAEASADVSEEAQSGRININTADSAQLCTLDGIGEVIAERIIEYRNECGGFSSAEEIMNVKGIGEKKFEAIKDKICV